MGFFGKVVQVKKPSESTKHKKVQNSEGACGPEVLDKACKKALDAKFKTHQQMGKGHRLIAPTVIVHNYRETMILGCTYTWKDFSQREPTKQHTQDDASSPTFLIVICEKIIL